MKKPPARKKGDIDIFKGLLFEPKSLSRTYNFGNDINTNISSFLQPQHVFYWTLNPSIAILFALDPKNERLHDQRVIYVPTTKKIDVYINMHIKDAYKKLQPGDFGLILRAGLPEQARFEFNQHLIEQEVESPQKTIVTHIGVVDKQLMNPKWLHINRIPKQLFQSAQQVAEYIKAHGRHIKWKRPLTPTLLTWAIQDLDNWDEDSAFNETYKYANDVRQLLSVFDYYEKLNK